MIEVAALQEKVEDIIQHVRSEGDAQMARWQSSLARPKFAGRALNLAYYPAVCHRDLRPFRRP
jgi:hypothetical protein